MIPSTIGSAAARFSCARRGPTAKGIHAYVACGRARRDTKGALPIVDTFSVAHSSSRD